MKHELNIATNDGWVVSLVSDKQIDLEDVNIESIIVQPVDDFSRRLATTVDTIHTPYRLRRGAEPK